MWCLSQQPFNKWGQEPGNWQAIEVLDNPTRGHTTGEYKDLSDVKSKEEAQIWIDIHGGGKILNRKDFTQLTFIQMEEHDDRVVQHPDDDEYEILNWIKGCETVEA